MDMVNDGKDIRLDTPQAVKEALASGKDLYNPQTGEFWWEYNYTGSIANTYVHLDDPNLLAVIDNPDFDLYEDIVGGLNYTGYITDSIETIIEDGEENAPLIDPRDEMFAQIASEDGWVIASPENVRKAVQSHMAEHGGEAPGKENGMDKTAEIAAWKENHIPIDRNGDDALVMHKMADGSREFIVAHGYDEETGHWGHGTYYDSLASAAADLEGRAVSVTQSLLDAQAPSHDDGDAHEDGRAVLREAVQVTSHGRVVSCAVHERPVSIHGESTRARAAAAALAAHVDAGDEVEEKEDKRRSR